MGLEFRSPKGAIALAALGVLTLADAARAQPPPPQSSGTFSLNASGLGGSMAWSPDQPLSAILEVGSQKVTGLVLSATLRDAAGDPFAGGDLLVCQDSSASCAKPIDSLPINNKVQKVYLRPRAGVTPLPGTYTGSVEFVANEGKSASIPITITVTNAGSKSWGCVVIGLSALMSLLVTLFVRNQAARAQMATPAGIVSDRLRSLERKLALLEKSSIKTAAGTHAMVKSWTEALTVKALVRSNVLPGLFWPGTGPAAPQQLQLVLDQASGWASALDHMINLGFAPLAAMPALDPAKAAAISTGWNAVDALAGPGAPAPSPAPSLSAIDAQIGAAVQAAQTVLQLGAAGGGTPASETENLHYQINILGLANWAFTWIATVAVGSYVMVMVHPDFGRAADYCFCIFWGLGLPTANQLAQTTSSSVAAVFGVNLPKAP